jgi:chromosome segregation ATPase
MKRMMTCLLLGMLVGCNSTPRENPVSKREQDRLAMKLADVERERDELKGQLQTMKTTTEQAMAAQKTAESKVTGLEQQVATLSTSAASADQLKMQLSEAQTKLADNTGRIKELTTQVEALKTELAKAGSTAPPVQPTPPAMNK